MTRAEKVFKMLEDRYKEDIFEIINGLCPNDFGISSYCREIGDKYTNSTCFLCWMKEVDNDGK